MGGREGRGGVEVFVVATVQPGRRRREAADARMGDEEEGREGERQEEELGRLI